MQKLYSKESEDSSRCLLDCDIL